MLTREHLLYRIRSGKIRPSFVDPRAPDLLALAARMIESAGRSIALPRGAIEAALRAHANEHARPKIARGLAKLVMDRMDFGEAGEESEALRRTVFVTASELLRGLPDGASFEAYQQALGERMELAEVRDRLFADLADQRPLSSWRAIDAETLLDRYNLGLAQGLLLYADQVTVELERPDLVEVRRLLRWLKFCRLVAWLERSEERWVLEVEGPGAILDMQKKYGLQLAGFLGAVPIAARFRVSAVIVLPRKSACNLELTEADPLVSPHAAAPGHLPEEIQAFVEGFDDPEWRIDATPEIRQVGVRDLAVPDFVLRHRETNVSIAVELFHRWHRAVLVRRMEALAARPDPGLVLGVDRSLLDADLEAAIEASERMFVFNAFPSKRALAKVLTPRAAGASRDPPARPSGDRSGA